MKRVTRNGVIAFAAASGAMAVAGPAFADSVADGTAAGSPGVISGNTVQLPVHVPVNVCGNTVNVVGLLNPAAGNRCANEGGAKKGGGGENPDGPSGGAAAQGDGKDSPGVLSGNGVQLPIHLPVNVTGNSVNVVGVGNPSVGNQSGNTSGDHPRHHPPAADPRAARAVEAAPGPGTGSADGAAPHITRRRGIARPHGRRRHPPGRRHECGPPPGWRRPVPALPPQGRTLTPAPRARTEGPTGYLTGGASAVRRQWIRWARRAGCCTGPRPANARPGTRHSAGRPRG